MCQICLRPWSSTEFIRIQKHGWHISSIMSEDDQLAFFPLFWNLRQLTGTTGYRRSRNVLESLLKEFEQYFSPSPMDQVLNTESVFNRNQKSGEKMRDYVAAMQKLACRIPAVDNDLLKCMVLRSTAADKGLCASARGRHPHGRTSQHSTRWQRWRVLRQQEPMATWREWERVVS